MSLERIKPEDLKDLNMFRTWHKGYEYRAEIRLTMCNEWALTIYIVSDSGRNFIEFNRVYRTAKAALTKMKNYWKGDAVEWETVL